MSFQRSFLFLGDDIDIRDKGKLTWYDTKISHPKRSEYRLYFSTIKVFEVANEGDSLFLCITPEGDLLAIIAQKNSTIENQLYWLFGIEKKDSDHYISSTNFRERRSEAITRLILEELGIEYQTESGEDYLEEAIFHFGESFPTTQGFLRFARSTVDDVDVYNNPDKALLKWFNREESIFRAVEKYLIGGRLGKGFLTDTGEADVDEFIAYSLSVQNRRKSRAGNSFENHIMAVFDARRIQYSHTKVTENRKKPDFILPGIDAYHSAEIGAIYLSMLGAKTTCKDRWRQVLDEAEKIPFKHLITMEPAITEYQTDQMKRANLQLVVPKEIHETYSYRQRDWLYTFKDFLFEAEERQRE